MIGIDRAFNKVTKLGFVKSLFVPDAFNAVIWVRVYQWLERYRLPTFFAYRYQYHIHGLEMANSYAAPCFTPVSAALDLAFQNGIQAT